VQFEQEANQVFQRTAEAIDAPRHNNVELQPVPVVLGCPIRRGLQPHESAKLFRVTDRETVRF
jgi:hypothetical protein